MGWRRRSTMSAGKSRGLETKGSKFVLGLRSAAMVVERGLGMVCVLSVAWRFWYQVKVAVLGKRGVWVQIRGAFVSTSVV
ncbi:uncharacterized protein BO95DRAFT_204660 [Aspergillus brunneoviolaceus CBS 621.78]|uniref:Uncharacterized protein n=1 Tax=Aspergillus brunneoviolaceus CBS 621.78 TaxID=1450534 RepID=A0ACD1G318_9EURO|nr:hypothetical protein BO95DRAFT_204660 [Aspergillus brunneoviolaceus CBS 621.78]RAH43563.1 hypothetical protein BO95DRAFT_204660 [Aspergillus brunneoviolaceus CBS 621.78]